jgi:hypothetical protein
MCGNGATFVVSPAVDFSTLDKHANVFTPLMFIAHDPQMPSRHDLRKLNEWSCSSLIFKRTSSIIGPQSFKSTEYD